MTGKNSMESCPEICPDKTALEEKKARIEDKRENEYKICALMIQIYCRGVHKNKRAMEGGDGMCGECRGLAEYVRERIKKCPFMETKTFCAMCRVHCYKSEMRGKIKKVMRYAGPRMIFYHPFLALKHAALTVKERISAGKK